jgi:hypothetical protein
MWCRKSAAWVYRLDESFSWESGHEVPDDYLFFDSAGKAWLMVERGGTITIFRSYAWNGCTPKLCLLDLLIGTPDGAVYAPTGERKTYRASLVHDALYQFLREASPLTRREADRFFLRLMQETDFVLAHVYWLAVRVFGWAFWHGTSRKRGWCGTREKACDLLPPGAEPTAAELLPHGEAKPPSKTPDSSRPEPRGNGDDNEAR